MLPHSAAQVAAMIERGLTLSEGRELAEAYVTVLEQLAASPVLWGVRNRDSGVVLTAGHRTEDGAAQAAKRRTDNYSRFDHVALYSFSGSAD
jgi:hypothetical protein